MQIEAHKLTCGDYKFIAVIDTENEVGSEQTTLFGACRVPIDAVPLTHFSPEQLLNALYEPQQTQLRALLVEECASCQQAYEERIAEIAHAYQMTPGQPVKKLPNKVKKQTHRLRSQLKAALRKIKAAFARRELHSLARSCFTMQKLASIHTLYEEMRHIRDFYFEETQHNTIRAFCQQFAENEVYRREVETQAVGWAKRNALFVRNLFPIVSESVTGSRVASDVGYVSRARTFFRWIDAHYQEILALPEYQRLQTIDTAFQPGVYELDPAIQLAVERLNQVPGLVTRFSCQGVSGTVHFQGYDLLAVSHHQKYAYVSFSFMGSFAHDAILMLLPEYPTITTCMPGSYWIGDGRILCSTGDNLRFRAHLLDLATRLLSIAEAAGLNDQVAQLVECNRSWWDPMYPLDCPPTSDPGGILPGRLEWLTEPSQIEHTLLLLFHLNHWAKARDRFLYADRQGLYAVKEILLRQAYSVGAITPCMYIDGTSEFAKDFDTDCAAGGVGETLVFQLTCLLDKKCLPVDTSDLYQRFYQRFTGRETISENDVDALDEEQIERYVQLELDRLIERSRQLRLPIMTCELEELLIEPSSLLPTGWGHWASDWSTLDVAALRHLDPEGLSLIAFRYESSTVNFIMHLPFRIAEAFVSVDVIEMLRKQNGKSREAGVFYGREITEDEARKFPIELILRELLVDVSSICPHKLINKDEYVAQRTARWHFDTDDGYEGDGSNDEEVIYAHL